MIKLIYIAGCTHSGTTLLHRVLGAHSRIVTIGGSKHLRSFARNQNRCSCGASTVASCSFWSQVNRLLAESGHTLASLNLDSGGAATFQDDNLRLYNAILRASGAEVIVDTSRNKMRLLQLQGVTGIDLLPIHLFKEPRRQISSWKRKNTPLSRSIRKYWTVNIGINRLCREFDRYYLLSYEEFCRDPEHFARKILTNLALEFEPRMLTDWGTKPLHVLGGNRMKESKSSAIYLDESYKGNLNKIETAATFLSCFLIFGRLTRLLQKSQAGPFKRRGP